MLEFNISCKEIPKMVELLKEYPDTINANIVDVFKIVLADIERIAKMNAPVDTGRLRADIGTKLKQRELEGVVYSNISYSVYVHEGTRYMKARPYLLNAIKGEEPKVVREMQRNALKEKRGLI